MKSVYECHCVTLILIEFAKMELLSWFVTCMHIFVTEGMTVRELLTVFGQCGRFISDEWSFFHFFYFFIS